MMKIFLFILFPFLLFSFSEPVPQCPSNWEGPSYSAISPGPSLGDTSCSTSSHDDGISLTNDSSRSKTWHVSSFDGECTTGRGYAGTIYYSYDMTCTCNMQDQDFPIDSSKYKIADSVAHISCQSDPDEVNNAISVCTAIGGIFKEISIKDCCAVSACIVPLDSNETAVCPPGQHNVSTDVEVVECVCDNGFPAVNGVCQDPECPPSYTNMNGQTLPFYLQTDTVAHCNFFPYGDNASLSPQPGFVCCYGQENVEDDSKCGTNELEINGECYPISENLDDDNQTDPHSCPTNYYWSFTENKCMPFYPDNNDTSSDASDNNTGDTSSGTSDDNTGDTSVDDGNSSVPAPTQSDFEKVISPAADKVKDILNSYVLIDLPINVTGSCDSDFSQTFTIFGRSYTVDISSYMRSADSAMSWIPNLVVFMFALSGVLMVLSSSKE